LVRSATNKLTKSIVRQVLSSYPISVLRTLRSRNVSGRSLHGSSKQIFGAEEQVCGRNQSYLNGQPDGDVGEAKNQHTASTTAE
jgi:hypothetical protein